MVELVLILFLPLAMLLAVIDSFVTDSCFVLDRLPITIVEFPSIPGAFGIRRGLFPWPGPLGYQFLSKYSDSWMKPRPDEIEHRLLYGSRKEAEMRLAVYPHKPKTDYGVEVR